jgi:SulP family sulfate permease
MKWLPAASWLRSYSGAVLRDDLRAGLVVAVMLVPQGMAYAALAGLPPITGLYASVIPLVAYALLGTSGQLAVGPVAVVSLLTADALAPLAGGDAATYLALAAALALMVGATQVLLGLLRMGALTNLLSHPVLTGFTAAAALIIGLSQVRPLLGLDLPRPHSFVGGVGDIIGNLSDVHWPTIAVGVAGVAALVVGRKLLPRFPTALVVVGVAIAVAAAADLADRGVAIIGDVPSGLPGVVLPSGIDVEALRTLIPATLTIALIGYTEGISIAKAMAAKTRQEVEANQEFIAIGAANLAAGLFQSFPIAGGFSRTAVNYQAGARTGMATLITAAAVALSVLFLTPLFFNLPQAILAAIIVVAVAGLVDFAAARSISRVRTTDGIALAATFLATLLLGIEIGIAIGVVVSLGLFVYKSATPHVAELGRVEGTTTFRNIRAYSTITDPNVAIVRLDGPLYFANANFLRARLLSLAASRVDLRTLILDASAVSELDGSADHSLREVIDHLEDAGIDIHLTTVRGPVRAVMSRSGLLERVGREHIHPDIEAALDAADYSLDGPLRKPDQTESPDEELF